MRKIARVFFKAASSYNNSTVVSLRPVHMGVHMARRVNRK